MDIRLRFFKEIDIVVKINLIIGMQNYDKFLSYYQKKCQHFFNIICRKKIEILIKFNIKTLDN